ncbi:MaoC family dehydratase N-terminal domain-containing protein [uncultured Jatrophihabitans sp.]|uniref:MaoC family dehydratase N-terminal domain-containing protein n=1 Tax=uncultured Jatrophihabitans sp. TaxID=1610747 RepID=UPI0035CA2FCF
MTPHPLTHTAIPDSVVTLERGLIRLFAKAIGESDPLYLDVDAARAAGHRDVLAPPTFLFALGGDRPEIRAALMESGADMARVLHGEQEMVYHQNAYAGDVLRYRTCIADVYEKRGGALVFVVNETAITHESDDAPVVTMRTTLILPRSAT